MNGGEVNGKRLLQKSTIDTIMKNQFPHIWQNSDSYYGLAFSVLTQQGENKGGQGTKGTFSWGGYFNTQYFTDPNEQIIGIIMKQMRGSRNDLIKRKFRRLVFEAIDN